MASIEELRQQAKGIQAQIQAKGGRGSAPNLVSQLQGLQSQIQAAGGSVKAPVGGFGGGGSKNPDRIGGKLPNRVGKDMGKAAKLADRYIDTSPLGTIGKSREGETNALLSKFGERADTAGSRSEEQTSFLNRLLESTKGYDSQELQAMREQRNREMNNTFQGGQAMLDRKANQYRVGGTQRLGQMAELARGYGQDRVAAEQDLFIKGADEKQKRLETYGTTLGTVEQNESVRAADALKAYQDAVAAAKEYDMTIDKINLGQESASKALKNAGVLGMFGILDARRTAKKANKLAREGYSNAMSIAEINKTAAIEANDRMAAAMENVANINASAMQNKDDEFEE